MEVCRGKGGGGSSNFSHVIYEWSLSHIIFLYFFLLYKFIFCVVMQSHCSLMLIHSKSIKTRWYQLKSDVIGIGVRKNFTRGVDKLFKGFPGGGKILWSFHPQTPKVLPNTLFLIQKASAPATPSPQNTHAYRLIQDNVFRCGHLQFQNYSACWLYQIRSWPTIIWEIKSNYPRKCWCCY